jgi:tRNA(fMet)-specific endonuclease VapC
VTDLLLDTTFLVDTERTGNGLDNLIADDDDVAVAAITIAELRVGVALAASANRPGREQFVDAVIATIPIIDYDLHIATVHAKLLTAVRRHEAPPGEPHADLARGVRDTEGRSVLTFGRVASPPQRPGRPGEAPRIQVAVGREWDLDQRWRRTLRITSSAAIATI